MRRMAWLPLLVVLSLSTAGFQRPESPAASPSGLTFSASPLAALAMPGHNISCGTRAGAKICASVSNANPARNTWITVYATLKLRGVAQVGKTMKVVWHYKSTKFTCTGVTDGTGLAVCGGLFKTAPKGHRVYVKVSIGKNTVTTYFTPK